MMSPSELLADARAALAAGTNMTLPRGILLCENHDGRNVYSFHPGKVIAWAEANLRGNVEL